MSKVYVKEYAAYGVIGTGSRLSACSLIELPFFQFIINSVG